MAHPLDGGVGFRCERIFAVFNCDDTMPEVKNKRSVYPGADERPAPHSTSLTAEESLPAQGPSDANLEQTGAFFLQLMQDDQLQGFLVKHFAKDVLLSEINRRGIIEPLMSCKEFADVLGITHHGLYKRLQGNTLDIPYVPIGQGGGYKFDPRDVREFINKKKIRPVVKPESLRRKVSR